MDFLEKLNKLRKDPEFRREQEFKEYTARAKFCDILEKYHDGKRMHIGMSFLERLFENYESHILFNESFCEAGILGYQSVMEKFLNRHENWTCKVFLYDEDPYVPYFYITDGYQEGYFRWVPYKNKLVQKRLVKSTYPEEEEFDYQEKYIDYLSGRTIERDFSDPCFFNEYDLCEDFFFDIYYYITTSDHEKLMDALERNGFYPEPDFS